MDKDRYIVSKANGLIRASYKLSLLEQKIVIALCSTIEPTDENFKEYTFTIKELLDLMGIQDKSKYVEIKRIANGLVGKTFEFREGNETTCVAWLSGARYHDGKGTITLQFSPWLKSYLLQLKNNFTSYRIKNVMQLKSIYAIRLYELLKQYQLFGCRTLTLTEMRNIFFLENQYQLYGDFKRYVILAAKKELDFQADISFDFEEIKSGRKVIAIEFKIKSNNPIKNKNENQKIKDNITAKRLSEFGLKHNNILKLLYSYDEQYINQNLDKIEDLYKNGKINNLGAFTITALRDDYRNIKSEKDSEILIKDHYKFIAQTKDPVINDIKEPFLQKIFNKY
jgi:plasmid replication initiation protein